MTHPLTAINDFPFLRGTFSDELVALSFDEDMISHDDDYPDDLFLDMKSEAVAVMQLCTPKNVHQSLVRQSIDFVIEHRVPALPKCFLHRHPLSRSSRPSQN
jgi:hypothetical protein